MIIDICKKIKRPENFQYNYIPFYKGVTTEKIDFRVSEDARIKFYTFAAVFKNSYDALDYLLYEEKNSRFNVVSFS